MKLYSPLFWSLGVILFSTACEMPPTASQDLSHQEIIQELTEADIVYLGEVHDRTQDHEAQLKILEALHEENEEVTIALEMFQRPFQGAIDRYLDGEINEEELREQTQYDQRWGFPWSYYAPLLRFAQENDLPVLALNTPTEITRQVSSQGLDSLEGDDFRYIPPREEIRTDDNPEYREMLEEVFDQHHGHGRSGNPENFIAAQILWDETMAEKVAETYQDNPEQQILVIAGQGHIIYGHGIPNRVERRLEDIPFTQRSVVFQESDREADEALADYLWLH